MLNNEIQLDGNQQLKSLKKTFLVTMLNSFLVGVKIGFFFGSIGSVFLRKGIQGTLQSGICLKTQVSKYKLTAS